MGKQLRHVSEGVSGKHRVVNREKIPPGLYTPSSRMTGTDMPGGKVYINTREHNLYAENYDKIQWEGREDETNGDVD